MANRDVACNSEDAAVELLEWDSQHYEMSVGRVTGHVVSPVALMNVLENAKSVGVQLVYFFQYTPFEMTPDFLGTYGGERVGGHTRYVLALPPEPNVRPVNADVICESYCGPADDPAITALGVAAGVHSRFRTDMRLPQHKCDELYSTWIRRSVLRELADEVIAAKVEGQICGLVTFRVKRDAAEIGLVSTAEAMRGRGVAGALLRTAHYEMCSRGLSQSEVVTQSENRQARNLYERAGYRVSQACDVFHFILRDSQLAGS